MDINSFLEVSLKDGLIEDDNECMIIEDSPDPPLILNEDPINIDDDSVQIASEMEPEILAETGVHFLQQQDPLSLSAPPVDGLNNNEEESIPTVAISESERNLLTVSVAEREYRKNYYNELIDVLNESLHCTICQGHVGCDGRLNPFSIEHPLLKVLVCTKCNRMYRSLHFVLNKNGKDVRCRWCGKLSGRPGATPLRHCQQCHLGFCEMCLSNNVQKLPPRHISWLCIGCNPTNIWATRCILWALQELLRTRFASTMEDISQCAAECKKKKQKARARQNGAKSKKVQYILPNPDVVTNGETLIPPTNIVLNGNVDNLRTVIHNKISAKQPRVITPPPSTSTAIVPHMTIINENRDTMDTSWLREKINSYEKDILNLITKLRRIRDDSLSKDTIQNITMRIETITTLLSLNSTLIKDCGINLMHEWKERRSRFELDSLNLNNILQQNTLQHGIPTVNISQQNNILANILQQPPNNSQQNISPANNSQQNISPANMPQKPLQVNKVTKPYVVRRKNPSTIVLKREHGSRKNITEDQELDELSKKYKIKSCNVKLKRLSIEVINSIKRRGSWNTKIKPF